MYNKNVYTNMNYRIIREDGIDQDIIIPMYNGILNFDISDFDIFDSIISGFKKTQNPCQIRAKSVPNPGFFGKS